MPSGRKGVLKSKFGGDRYFSTLNGLVHTFITVGRKCAAMGGRGKKKKGEKGDSEEKTRQESEKRVRGLTEEIKEGGRLFSEAAPLFWPLSMKEITAPGNLHKHAPLLPPPLFMINEIRLAFAHRFGDVIADNCLSLPKLEAALVDAFITTVCSK